MDSPLYRPVPSQVDLPAMERDILAFWREHDTFVRTLKISEGRPQWAV
jgi:isoleucyl-tRNA synthetase